VLILRAELPTFEGSESVMADRTSAALARVPGDNPVAASPDLLRAMVQTFAEALMSAEARRPVWGAVWADGQRPVDEPY